VTSRFSVYVAEDEPLAREDLVARFERTGRWHVQGAAADGETALQDCLRECPDLLVTDLRMPRRGGLELCAALRAEGSRAVFVIVTAHAEHGVDAFRLEAADYLLKPVGDADFARCLERVETLLRNRALLDQLAATGSPLEAPERTEPGDAERLVIRSIGRIDFVPMRDVIAFKSERNYVEVVTAARTWLHRETLRSLSERLDPRAFVQIHRSVIVAVARVRGLERDGDRTSVVLDTGDRYPVAQSFAAAVERTFGL
jgi:two-component system LytT family response regulator